MTRDVEDLSPLSTTAPLTNHTTPPGRYSEMSVHPGITTLASCLIIAVLLGVYLSMGSIRSFFRARLSNDREGGGRLDCADMVMDSHSKSPEAIQIKVIDSSADKRSTDGLFNEGLPTYGNVVDSAVPDEIHCTTECSNNVAELVQLAAPVGPPPGATHDHPPTKELNNNNPPSHGKLVRETSATVEVK